MNDQDAFLAQFLPKASGAPAAKGPAKKAPKAAGRPAGRASASKIPSTAEDCKIGGWYKVAGTIMREGEAMDSNKAGYLDAGVEVEILERGSGETGRRVRVRAGKQEGWISVVSSAGVSLLKPIEASVSATILQELTGGRGATSSKAKPGDSIASLLGSWAGGEDAQAEEALGPSIADLLSGSLSGNFEDLAADEAAKLPEEEKVSREERKEAKEEPPVAEPAAEEAARQPAREQDAGLRPSRATSRFAAFSQRAAQQPSSQPSAQPAQPQARMDSTREEEKGKAEVDEAPQEAPAEQKEVKPSKALSRFDRWSQGAGATAPKPAAGPVHEKPAPEEVPREPQEQPAAPPASSPPEEQKAAVPTRARAGRSRFDSWQQAKSSGSGA